MKITREYPKQVFTEIAPAVSDALTPSAYSYDGEIEQLRARLDLQKEFIVKLTSLLVGGFNLIKANELEYLLGYGYSVED